MYHSERPTDIDGQHLASHWKVECTWHLSAQAVVAATACPWCGRSLAGLSQSWGEGPTAGCCCHSPLAFGLLPGHQVGCRHCGQRWLHSAAAVAVATADAVRSHLPFSPLGQRHGPLWRVVACGLRRPRCPGLLPSYLQIALCRRLKLVRSGCDSWVHAEKYLEDLQAQWLS